MRLYHGTSEYAATEAIKKGLQPRSHVDGYLGNWEHTIGSNPNAVYLTSTYACHFAFQARSNHPRMMTKDKKLSKRIAVIEIETAKLRKKNLCVDEDAWEQIGRGRDGIPGNMKMRTLLYREHARENNNWEASLKALGTCAYYGIITPRHFTRVAFFDAKTNPRIALGMTDGSVTIQAFQICGALHRNYIHWLFGDEYERDMLNEFDSARNWWNEVTAMRDGVEVRVLK